MSNESVSKDRDFETQTKVLFDESVAALDGQTRSRLTQARFRALEELAQPKRSSWNRTWMPAGAVAAVAMLSVLLWQGQQISPTDTEFRVAVVTDLEILLAEEELEMIEELEFYAWLEAQTELPSGGIVEDGIG